MNLGKREKDAIPYENERSLFPIIYTRRFPL